MKKEKCEHEFDDYHYCSKCDNEQHICTKCGEHEANYLIDELKAQRDSAMAERDDIIKSLKLWMCPKCNAYSPPDLACIKCLYDPSKKGGGWPFIANKQPRESGE